ncbi:MAG: ABC transporter permease subunit [Actinomycetaceae bacterium]|nr:ABC transporter permease subunit [Actinomycetaceae bacterium]
MNWLLHNFQLLPDLIWAHLVLALPAIALSFLISIPLSYWATRSKRLGETTLTATSLLYAIPALPLFILIPAIFGIPMRSLANVIIVLTLYGLALMVRSGAEAFSTLPQRTLQSALALGYSPAQRFFAVDLPLAGPALLSGLRVVSVSTIALVTLSAVLGVPSLGQLLTDGFQRSIIAEILVGLALTGFLALVIDAFWVFCAWLLLPWTRRVKGGTS